LLFGLLLAMLWLFGLTVAHKKTAVDASFLVPTLQAGIDVSIDSITLKRKVKGQQPEIIEFVKDKDSDTWYLKLPGVANKVKLDSFKVDKIVRQIKDARRSDEAGVTNDLALYGLDDPATVLTLKGKAGVKESDGDGAKKEDTRKERQWQFFIGKESADGAFMYVNSSDRPGKVYAMAKTNIDSVLFKDPNHLRSRTIFSFSDSAVELVDVKDSTSELELKKGADGTWRFEKPAYGFADFEGPPPPKDLPPAAKPPAEGGIKGLLANISTLRVDADDDFVPLSDAKLDSFGLADGKEALRIEVGASKFGLDKKELTKEILVIGLPTKDQKQVYARIAGDQGVFKLNAKLLEPIKAVLQNSGTLRSLDVASIDTKKVDAVTVAKGSDKVSLFRPEGKSWEQEVGTGKLQKTDQQHVQALLDAVQGKRAIVKFYDGDDFKKLDAEMKNPTAVVAAYIGGLEEAKKDERKSEADKKEGGEKKETKKEDKKDETPRLKKDAKAAVTLNFGAADKDTVNVERVLADGTVSRFAVAKSVLDQVAPGDVKLSFLDTDLPDVGFDEVDRVTVTGGREKIDIEKGWGEKSNRWFFKEGNEPPGKSPTDVAKTITALNRLIVLSAKKWLHKIDPKDDLDKYGLKAPQMEVTLRVRKDRPAIAASLVAIMALPSEWRGLLGETAALANRLAGPGETVVLKIGKEAPEDVAKSAVYAQRSDKDLLFLLPSDFARMLRELDLQDRASVFLAQPLIGASMLGLLADSAHAQLAGSPLVTNLVQHFDAAKVKEFKIAVRTREELRTLTFKRDYGPKANEWRDLSGLQEFNIDSQKVNQAVESLAAFKASRWVSLAGGAKGEQKLSAKDATLRIEVVLEGGKSYTLTVGGRFETAGFYAQTSAMPDAVFLLSASQVEPFLQGPAHFAKERVALGP
jgi:hypothetical protein